jgi:hypothetical protein
MKEGDQVALGNLTVTLVKLPRSAGRSRPRALVSIDGAQQWVFMDELKELPDEPQG